MTLAGFRLSGMDIVTELREKRFNWYEYNITGSCEENMKFHPQKLELFHKSN